MADPSSHPAETKAQAEPPPGITRRMWLSWLGQGVLAAAVYFGVSAYSERGLLSGAAPAFALRDLSGKEVTLASLRGKRVLLHFWATWCGVCRQEFGALNDVAAQAGPDAVVMSVVSDADDIERLRQFAKAHSITYPVLLATDAVVAEYAVHAFPTNYFLDNSGNIVTKTVGMSTRWGDASASRLGPLASRVGAKAGASAGSAALPAG